MDATGNLFGTSYGGGTNNTGLVFEIAKGSTGFTTVATFDPTNGQYPDGDVALDAAGNLYGTTEMGGPRNDGTVFEIAKGSTIATLLASFDGSNGGRPEGGVVVDPSGNVFGTTSAGGPFDGSSGTVFEVAKGSNAITTIAIFDGSNGSIRAAT